MAFEKSYFGNWTANRLRFKNIIKYANNSLIKALVGIYFLSITTSCAFRNNYTINGVRLDNKLYADSGQIATDSGGGIEESWWRKNWPYVAGGILVGGIMYAIIASDDKKDDKKSDTIPVGCLGGYGCYP